MAAPGTPEATCSQVVNDGESFIPAQDHGRVRKRAFRRAIRRAQRDGAALYRGKALYANVSWLPPTSVNSPEGLGSRVKVFSWNCDGLTETLYAEIMCWLHKHDDISIVYLQETHWSKTMEWTKDGWHFCHSASLRANTAGVLIGVRSSLANANTISWHEAVPGRLLQVRCFHGNQHMDLVCAYQHAMGFGDGSHLQKIYQKRRSFWTALAKLLSSLPFRSHVVLGGDFNCSVDTHPRLVGCGIVAGPTTEAAKADRRLFMDVLRAQQLCLLNTWGGRLATYQHPKGRSQIDFLAVRAPLADNIAKTCCPVESLLAGWRSAGHKPLVASLRALWRPWASSKPAALDIASRAASALGYGQQAALSELHVSLQSRPAPSCQRPRMPARESSYALITGFWRLRRRVTQLRWSDRRGIFQAWKLSVQLLSKKRELDRHLRQTKRAQILNVLQSAVQKKHTGSFYGFVNLLCPKSQPQRIRLRSDSGQLLDQKAECALLAKYATTLFRGEPWPLPELLSVSPELFSAAHWHSAFRAIPWNKAAPVFTPSINTWKTHAGQLCDTLAGVAEVCFAASEPHIPTEWASVQIAWLPKPSKTPSTPAHLRTIGLMSGDHKALLHIIKTHISEPILTAMSLTPQYAYRKNVSTLNAISRSAQHCLQVRRLLESQRTDLATKIAGRHQTALCGGIMANLDLAKAFDTLPYKEIYLSLQEACIDEPLCRLIIHLHASTRCAILHGDHCATVPMSRGLRQGCPIAPIIFAAWSVRVCRLIDAKLGKGWSLKHLTLFSDDTHSYWMLNSLQDLEHAVSQLLLIISVLSDAGMSINFTKSAVVCVLRGRGAAAAQRRYFRWRDGALHLRLQRDSVDLHVPLSDTLEYLGIVLGYGNFELPTARLRATKAQANYARLHKVLRVNGPLSAKQRLRVYAACVLSCFLYGLLEVGVSASCFKILMSGVCGHLRKLLRIYQEGVSNAQVLERAGFDLASTLRGRATSLVSSIEGDPHRRPQLKTAELAHACHVVASLDAALDRTPSSALTRVRPSAHATLDCPICGQYFLGDHNLVMHINSKHPELNQQSKITFLRHKHALHGIPRCRFCRATLYSWQVLEQHLTCGMCPRIKDGFGRGFSLDQIFADVIAREQTDPPEPPVGIESGPPVLLFDRPEHSQPLHEFLRNHTEVQQYSKQCALCGQKQLSAGKFKTHWRSTHPAAWHIVEAPIKGFARSLTATFCNPCPYCLSTAKDPRAHAVQCPSLFQVLAVRHLRQQHYSADELQKEAGPGSRQSERRSAYLDYDPKALPIARALRSAGAMPTACKATERGSADTRSGFFGGSGDASAAASGSACPAKVPLMFTQFKGAAVVPSTTSGSARSGVVSVSSWCLRIRLANPHTQCYINSAILALGHVNTIQPVSPSLAAVFRICQEHADGAESASLLHIVGHSALTALTPAWYFGVRQQDVFEYLEGLLRLDFSVLWSARVLEEGARL